MLRSELKWSGLLHLPSHHREVKIRAQILGMPLEGGARPEYPVFPWRRRLPMLQTRPLLTRPVPQTERRGWVTPALLGLSVAELVKW